jgi:dephospho-CoA kinase
MVFYVAPLLIEAGITSRVDEVWVVYLDRESQIHRLMTRDGITRQEALQRIDSQMPMEEKRRYARIVIDNCGTLAELEEQVRKIWDNEQ